jgi:hypothetical protein
VKSSSDTFPELLESGHGHSSAFHLVLFFKLQLDYYLSFLHNPPPHPPPNPISRLCPVFYIP